MPYTNQPVVISMLAKDVNLQLTLSSDLTTYEFYRHFETLAVALGYISTSIEEAILARAAEIKSLDAVHD